MILKKGQVTIFVIISLLVVIGLAIFFYSKPNLLQNDYQRELKTESDKFYEYVVSCLTSLSENSVYDVMAQGGYYEKPEKAREISNDTFLPYYYFEGKKIIPGLEFIESEISKSIGNSAVRCIDNANFLFEVNYTKIEPSVKILDESVNIEINMPIKIKKEDYTSTFNTKKDKIIIPVKLKSMREIAEFFVEDVSDGTDYCLNCLGDFAAEKELYVDVLGLDSTTSAIIISEEKAKDYFIYYFFLTKFGADEPALSEKEREEIEVREKEMEGEMRRLKEEEQNQSQLNEEEILR